MDSSANMRRTVSLPNDALESIFRRLPRKALARTQALSTYWKPVAETLLSILEKSPSLLIRRKESSSTFFHHFIKFPGDTNSGFGRHKKYIRELNLDSFLSMSLVGSSHGWLIFFDEKTMTPFMFNPLTEVSVSLLPLKPLLHVSRIGEHNSVVLLDKFISSRDDVMRNFGRIGYYFKGDQGKDFVTKAILTTEPFIYGCGIILLIGSKDNRCKLAFHRINRGVVHKKKKINKDGTWSWIGVRNEWYEDVTCCKRKMYALRNRVTIDIWDLQNGYPKEQAGIKVVIPTELLAMKAELVAKSCIISHYLVASKGEILYVLRFMDYYRGKPYKTKHFHIFKLDKGKGTWEEVESLGDRSLFLGRNQSVSVSVRELNFCKANSIYFTDDQRPLMSMNSLYGYEAGRYDLKDRRIFPFLGCEMRKSFRPPLLWIIPN